MRHNKNAVPIDDNSQEHTKHRATMKKLHRIRYLLATAFFIHAAVFTRLETMMAPTDLAEESAAMLPFHLLPPKRHGDEARQVLKDYMDMHSVTQLERECPTSHRQGHTSLQTDCPMMQQRKFAVGFFSCPLQAGNRLHHFLSAIAWAITTNRTLLWKYYDHDTCRQVGNDYDRRICSNTGTRKKCETLLQLASWIPSYDEWSFASGKWTEVSYWSTHYPPAKNVTTRKHPWHEDDRNHAGIDMDGRTLLDFGQLLGQDFRDLWSKQTREYLLYTDEARDTAQQLLGESNIMLAGDYLYGMLFHSAFSFSDTLLATAQPTSFYSKNEATIAIHSRHSSTKDDGSVVQREVECLQKMLLQVQRRPCRVFAMSDRPKALEGIYKAATEMGCNVTIANHKMYGRETSFSLEHGPYAGGGFFLDMALASQARNGLVGTRRSSTMLLAELMAFGRLNDTHRTKHRHEDEPYIFCDYEHGCDCTTVVDASL